ncbi:bifunctional metallophosphatase/5'-nucleotidase [bacterium]|nr:bifunctional metallophosphatase/5'-nucleotidase [bacterium]
MKKCRIFVGTGLDLSSVTERETGVILLCSPHFTPHTPHFSHRSCRTTDCPGVKVPSKELTGSRACKLFAFLIIAVVLCFSVSIFAGDTTVALIELNILHTNDIHGHIKPYSNGIGGMVNLEAHVKKLRAEGRCDLLIDSGDLIHKGNSIDLNSHGEATFKLFDLLEYDIFTPGNNELKEPFQRYLAFRDSLDAPFIGCNIKNNGASIFDDAYKAFDLKGIKIAVVGLSYCGKNSYVKGRYDGWDNVEFLPWEKALANTFSSMEKADIIILVSHNGMDFDRNVLTKFPQIDIVISGHDHRITKTPDKAADSILVETGCYLNDLGILTLLVSAEDKKISDVKYELIPLVPLGKGKGKLARRIRKYDRKYNKKGKEVLGYLKESLDSFERSAEFTARAFCRSAKTDFALINDGSEREFLPAGPVTAEWLRMKSPYQNDLVVAEVDVERIRALVERFKGQNVLFFWSNADLPEKGTVKVAMDSYLAEAMKLESTAAGMTEFESQADYLSTTGTIEGK